MKKIIIAFLLFTGAFVNAQQEIKVDLADAIIFKTLELSYEHYISDQSSVGISALFNFEKQNADFRYNENEVFTPYFRHYFTSSRNWNHFGEVFLAINSGKKELDNSFLREYTDGAIGIAVGSKYISNGGFIIGTYAGLGRNLFTSESYAVVPRVGINVGYRFN
ncbi:MAG TPA: hypothetical protein DDE71_05910 [Tenacibaculum sp.]|nr:hypothetical protein [Tenacibaculum sp.]